MRPGQIVRATKKWLTDELGALFVILEERKHTRLGNRYLCASVATGEKVWILRSALEELGDD